MLAHINCAWFWQMARVSLRSIMENVAPKTAMSPECRPYAVVIMSVSPDNGVKTEKEKPT